LVREVLYRSFTNRRQLASYVVIAPHTKAAALTAIGRHRTRISAILVC
jgi:hypothetical protein